MKSTTVIRLYGNTVGDLTTDDTTAFPVTFGIADVRDISKRTGTFSKSIIVHGTPENNRLLNFYFDVNVQAGTFDINRLQECDVVQNGITIMNNMIIQLISVNKDQQDTNYEHNVSYTLLLKDRSGDFYTQLANKELTDLTGFSGMTEVLTAANVIASFNNTYLDGYKYLTGFISEANGGQSNLQLKQCQPAIYAKTYMDRIFSNAGYSYQWDEQFDEFVGFDKLLIPYNGDIPKTSLLDSAPYLVIVANTAQTQNQINSVTFINNKASLFSSVANVLTFPNEIQDLQGLWATNTSTYFNPNIPTNTHVNFTVTFDYQLIVVNPTGSAKFLSTVGGVADTFIQGELFPSQSQLPMNGASFFEYTIPRNTSFANGTTVITGGTGNVGITADGVLVNNYLKMSAKMHLTNTQDSSSIVTCFYTTANPAAAATSFPNVSIRLAISNIRMEIESLDEIEYGYNVPVRLQNFIPKKIKQAEFVKSIFQMYNLYAEVDRDNPKKLVLKSRDQYYDEGQIVDWTYKLDKGTKQDVKFLPELQQKVLILSYKPDKDFENETYLNAVGEVYGQMKYIFDNEYTKGEKRQEVLFSPTLCRNTDIGTVVPLIDSFAPKNNIRILYDGGELPCRTYNIVNYYTGTTQPTASIVAVTSYPFANHWNRPSSPTFDINWGVCDYYPRTDNFGSVTNNNLYNLFWRRTLNQINTGKMLTANFNLNEVDIQKLRLSQKIRIDNSWWIINKIIDYDANANKTTKVELLSVDDSIKLAPYLTRPVRQLNNTNPLIRRPLQSFNQLIRDEQRLNFNTSGWLIPIQGENNWVIQPRVSSPLYGSIYGRSNYLAGDGFIFGNNNVSTGKKAFVIGDNNLVSGDNLTNVVIFGNNITAVSGNTMYTENIVISSGGTINGVDTTGVLLSHGNTGVLTFSGISAASSTQISISPVTGFVVDNETNANVPAYIYVTYSGTSAITVNTISSSTVSYVLLDNAGVPFFQTTFPTSAQRKANIWLGKMSHPNLTTLGVVVNEPDFITSPLQQYRDLFQATPYINNGVYPSANGANLNVNTTTGSILGDGINFHLNNRDPNTIVEPPHTPLSFVYRTQTGGTTGFVIAINPASYDVGGIVTPVGGGANTSTLQYIFLIPAVGYTIIYGQTTYSSLADAIAAVGTENPTIFPNLINNSLLIGVLAVNKNATQLNDPAQAKFFRADIFGQIIGAVGGTSTGTLQTAYNNSGIPQITTTSLNGAVTFRGWDGASNRVLEIQNATGGTATFFNEGGGIGTSGITGTTVLGIYNTPFAHAHDAGLILRNPNGSDIAMGVSTDGTFRVKTNGQGLDILNGTNELILGGNSRASINAFNSTLYFYVGNVERGSWAGDGKLSIGFAATGTSAVKLEVSGGTQFFGGVSGRTLNLSGLTLASAGTIHLGINTSNEVVTLPPDESTEFICRNTSGVSIPAGAPVYISGGFGNRPTVAMASSNSGTTNAFCIGLMKATTANNADGICIMAGVADGLNTNAWVAGTSLYLSLTAGVLTDIVPPWPEIVVQVATVARQHATQGSLLVRPLLTFKLDKLVDLNISAATNGQVLAYNAVQSAWTNSSTARLTGLTANTISATTYLNLPSVIVSPWTAGTGSNSAVLIGGANIATGSLAVAQGNATSGTGFFSHSEGWTTRAVGDASHSEGRDTRALGNYSHAEGFGSSATTEYTHAEGNLSRASATAAHAEGQNTRATGEASHAEGNATLASGFWSHAEGNGSTASNDGAHAEGGGGTVASGFNAHAEGSGTLASGDWTHSEGKDTDALGHGSHAEGRLTTSTGDYSHAEGRETIAQGTAAHAEGFGSSTLGTAAHAEGNLTLASDNYAHSEGDATQANGVASHAEGQSTAADGDYSHAEGQGTTASFDGAHAEGLNTTAAGQAAHAEGGGCVATDDYAHAEGFATIAALTSSHAEGHQTQAVAPRSHAEGSDTFASGHTSHAGGVGAMTKNIGEWARSSYGENSGGFGQYGIVDYVGTTSNATPTEIFIGNTERLFIESGSTYRYEITMLARAANGEAKERKGPGLISHSGSTTFFIGNPNLSMTTQFQSAGFTTVAINQIADDTIDALRLEVTGLSATTLQWYVKLDYIKIS